MEPSPGRVVFFGSFDEGTHPRVRVLREGLAEHGFEILVANRPLGLSTRDRVDILSRPSRLPRLLLALLRSWVSLVRQRLAIRGADAVVVGYLGHFDVLLARLLFPRSTIVLDYLVSAADTARDRRLGSPTRDVLLRALDRIATRAASIVIVDTEENLATVPPRRRSVVVPVGAPSEWFSSPRPGGGVVFFGLFTPLQGAETMAAGISGLLEQRPGTRVTMIGHGQDRDAALAELEGRDVTWIDWVEPVELPSLVASHALCLGIFGSGEKARRVVPNKCYQGAAAGALVVTSDTPPQRRHLPPESVLVAPGDPTALAAELVAALDNNELMDLRAASHAFAVAHHSPIAVTEPLAVALSRDDVTP